MDTVSVSVFGPADQGKSTLVGYLYAALAGQDIDSLNRRIRTQGHYEADKKYSYLVDTRAEERLGRPGNRIGKGTSQTRHFLDVPIGGRTFLLIDNPGHRNLFRVSARGISLGDNGIFLIAANELYDRFGEIERALAGESLNAYQTGAFRDFLLPLSMASAFGMQRLLIGISKMDLVDYSEEVFRRLEQLIRRFLLARAAFADRGVKIVPFSINVSAEQDSNVTTKGELSWYGGNTLQRELESLPPALPKPDEVLFLPIESMPKVPGHRLVVTGKIVTGTLAIDQRVRLGPTRYAASHNPEMVTARVKSVQIRSQSQRPDTTDSATREKVWKEFASQGHWKQGDIVGVSLSIRGDIVPESHAVLVDEAAQVSTGSVAVLRFDRTPPATLSVADEVSIFLDGRPLSGASVIGHRDSVPGEVCLDFGTTVVAVVHGRGGVVGSRALMVAREGVFTGRLVDAGQVEWIRLEFTAPVALAKLELHEFGVLVREGLLEDQALNQRSITMDLAGSEFLKHRATLQGLAKVCHDSPNTKLAIEVRLAR